MYQIIPEPVKIVKKLPIAPNIKVPNKLDSDAPYLNIWIPTHVAVVPKNATNNAR